MAQTFNLEEKLSKIQEVNDPFAESEPLGPQAGPWAFHNKLNLTPLLER